MDAETVGVVKKEVEKSEKDISGKDLNPRP